MTPPFAPRVHGARRALLVSALWAAAIVHPSPAGAVLQVSRPDGYWASPAPPVQRQHAAVHIPDLDLLVAVAPGASPTLPSEVWALPLAEADAWIRLSDSGPAFGPGLVAVHDPLGGRILVQGGKSGVEGTWALELEPEPAWREIVPASDAPPPRWNHSAVYDSKHERVVIFGGTGSAGPLGDAWELRLRGERPLRWSPLPARGPGPGARAGHAAIFDPDAARMIVFGGGDAAEESDAWELAFHGTGIARWRRIPLTGGPGSTRTEHTLVRDPASGTLWLHGGAEAGGVALGDVWTLRLGDQPGWVAASPAGMASPPRAEHVAVLDPVRRRVVVSGGLPPAGGRNETWALDVSGAPRWDRFAPVPDLPVLADGGTRGAFDTKRGRLLLVQSGRTWILDFAPNPRWSRVFDAPTSMNDVYYDPALDRLVMHGGFLLLPSGGSTSETWELPLGDGFLAGYRSIVTFGAPPARRNHVVAHDTRRDRMLVFGGLARGLSCAISVDAYALSMASPDRTWSGLASSVIPEGGAYAVGAYDEANDRLVVHGGLFGCRFPDHPSGMPFDGTWAIDLAGGASWRRLASPLEGPSGGSDAAYDPVGRRMLVAKAGTRAWTFDLDSGAEAWRMLAPGGLAPIITTEAAFDHDPGRDRFVLVTGQGLVHYYLPDRRGHPAHPTGRQVTHGSLPDADAVDARAHAEPSIQVRSNPVRHGSALAVALPGGAPGRLELLDVRGRVLASMAVPAGTRHSDALPVAGRASGIYLVRWIEGARSVVRKFVLLP